jgi:hypothetical protein
MKAMWLWQSDRSGRGKPIFGPQPINTLEFTEITGDHPQPPAAGVAGYEDVIPTRRKIDTRRNRRTADGLRPFLLLGASKTKRVGIIGADELPAWLEIGVDLPGMGRDILVESPTPRSSAISRWVRPLVRTSRTASSSNSFVNRRCCFMGGPLASSGPLYFPEAVPTKALWLERLRLFPPIACQAEPPWTLVRSGMSVRLPGPILTSRVAMSEHLSRVDPGEVHA